MSDTPASTQLDKFKEAARDLETDDDPKRFEKRLEKLVKHKSIRAEDDSAAGGVSGRGQPKS